jgi:hypothetical protein
VRYVKGFFAFWYDFLIGDDWRIAAGTVVALLLAAATAHWLNDVAAGGVLLAGVLITGGLALRRSVQGKA